MRGVPVKVGGVCSATRCRRLPAFLAAVLAFGVCILVAGCRDIATTWSAEARSPDGHWVATARTQQWGGPGTAYDATSVFLKQGSQPPTQILGFSHQYATMNLKMTWVTPAHLEVTYGPSERPGDHVSVDLQVVRIAGVDISLRKLSGESLQ
jgi:hypothetical protein